MRFSFSLILISLIINQLNAQCSVNISNSDTINFCQGEPLSLKASVNKRNGIVIDTFGTNGLTTNLWDSVSLGDYTNQCSTIPYLPTSNTYYWSSDSVRILETIDLNLNYNNVEICFDLKMGVQADTLPCEGPDLEIEGVSFQFSIDGGATWEDIIYFSTLGTLLPTIPTNSFNQQTGPSNFTEWNQYCFQIPSNGLTSSTKLKWKQDNFSGNGYDNWGIDDIFMFTNSNYQYYWNVQTAYNDSLYFIPTNDTVVTLTYTDLVDSCSSSVYLASSYFYEDVFDTICQGQSITLNNGTIVNNTGIYQDTINNTLNCDTILNRNVYVSNPIQVNGGYLIFCDTIQYNGVTYSNSTTVNTNFYNTNGCDSLYSIFLIKNNTSIFTYDTLTFCDSIQNNGIWYYSTDTLVELLNNNIGCDSTATTYLVENQPSENIITINFCDSIQHNGIWYYNSDTLLETHTNTFGCDSIAKTYLVENQPSENITTVNFCDSIQHNGMWYYSSDTLIETYTNTFGCDSIEKTFLILKNNINGNVKTSLGNPLQNSKIYLIEYILPNDSIYVIDSTFTSNSGDFSFNNLSSFNYYIKVIPNVTMYPNEIPTYFLNSPVFQYADSLSCDVTQSFNSIAGINPGGNGFISGTVGHGAGKNNELGQLIENLNIILVNQNNSVVAVTQTDINGEFQFSSLACNLYKIWIDDLRVDNDTAPIIELSSQECVQENLQFTLNDLGFNQIKKVTGIKNSEKYLDIILYPNPANDYISINFNDNSIKNVTLEVVDVLGRIIYVENIDAKEIKINTLMWSSGVYHFLFKDLNSEMIGAKRILINRK